MKFLEIAKKDLKAEFRTKQMLNSMVIFALLVIVIFSFAFGNEATIFVSNLNKKIVDLLAPGMLWIAFTFAGMLGLSRSFAGEKEEGCLEGLKLCPADRSAIYNGKVLSNAVLMFLMEMATLPIFVVLFSYDIKNLPGLIVVIILGTLGFIFVGTLLSALTVNTTNPRDTSSGDFISGSYPCDTVGSNCDSNNACKWGFFGCFRRDADTCSL